MTDSGDIETEMNWRKVMKIIRPIFGEVEDAKDVVFLVGLQELGMGFRKFSKDEKINVMHVGLCTLLERYGYYEYESRDQDGWPHWKVIQELPALTEKESDLLLKQALIDYFNEKEMI
jgi:hypothetical protein